MEDFPAESDATVPPQVPWDSMGEEQGNEPVADELLESSESIDPPPPPEAENESAKAPAAGGGWTLPLLCGGLALIACCAIIPQADTNRRLAYERKVLQAELQTVEKQIAVNTEFLGRVGQDPTLAERLAQRQMKVIPQGSRVLDLPQQGTEMSPFQLVALPPPVSPRPYQPIGGVIARLCYDSHSRLYLIGVALGMIATGLVLGSAPPK
jgi:hypothetical protein